MPEEAKFDGPPLDPTIIESLRRDANSESGLDALGAFIGASKATNEAAKVIVQGLVDRIGEMRVVMLGMAEAIDPGPGDHMEHIGASQLREWAEKLREGAGPDRGYPSSGVAEKA